MPRTKVTSISDSKKTSAKKIVAKKKPVKKIIPEPEKKKVKKVMVDIIEDEVKPLSVLRPAEEGAEEEIKESDDDIYNRLVTEKYEDEPLVDEIDSQKKFFAQLSKEAKPLKSVDDSLLAAALDAKKAKKQPKHVGLYRNLVWKFLAATFVLLIIVFYFSFTKLTIEITPKGEALNDSLFLKVSAGDNSQNSSLVDAGSDPRTLITGSINKIPSSLEAVYPATGEEFGDVALTGQVKIINNNNKSQALVATTRILTPDNKLFRIKNAVNVPAGGEVSVDIYSDTPSPEMAIGPTMFTIPGLWAGLQDKVFARSDTAFTYDKKVIKFIKETDLESATQDINDRLMSNASSTESDKSSGTLYSADDSIKTVFSAKAGDLKDEFSAKAEGNIIAVTFSKDQVIKLVTEKLNLLIPDDKELINFNPDSVVYTLDSYDANSNTATIKATFSGTMALKADSTIVNRDQLVNLTKDQIDNYLKDFPGILSYNLKFFPSFIKKAPSLVDRINIVIDKANQ